MKTSKTGTPVVWPAIYVAVAVAAAVISALPVCLFSKGDVQTGDRAYSCFVRQLIVWDLSFFSEAPPVISSDLSGIRARDCSFGLKYGLPLSQTVGVE